MESHRSTFGFRGLHLEVQCNLPAPLKWLEEFMLPAMGLDGQADAHRTIRVTLDPQRHEELLRQARPEPDRRVDCFSKDGSFEQLAAWHDQRGRELLYSALGECFLVQDQMDASIELIAPADHGMMRRCLMRLVRELGMIQAMHQGDLFLHGAAVECQGRAIVITGARRAGKTTMLINALRQSGVRYLANDRVFIERQGGAWRAWGMPTIIAVRAPSLGHLPALSLPQWGHPWRHYLTMYECRDGSSLILPPHQDPPAMNPAQFCRWLGAGMCAGAPLGAVICPQVDEAVGGFSLHRLAHEQAAEQLRANLFRSGPGGAVGGAFVTGSPTAAPDDRHLEEGCDQIAHRCPVLACRIGPAAFGSPNVWDAILGAVADQPTEGR